MIGVLSTVSAVTLGLLFAYATSRPEVPLHNLFKLIDFLPLVSPPFVGQVNLLQARAEAGRLLLGTLRLPIPPDAAPPEPGREAILAFRPEAIRIEAGADAPDGLTGQVVSRTYLGTTVRYRIALAGQTLTVDDHDPAEKPLLEGRVLLSFDPSLLGMQGAP
jgi:ABC-type Fe3+/spermidine/putrescine transport system ATPase subunit